MVEEDFGYDLFSSYGLLITPFRFFRYAILNNVSLRLEKNRKIKEFL